MIKIIHIIDQRIKITVILQIKIIRNKLLVQNSSLSTHINLCYFSFTMHDIVIRNIMIGSFSCVIIIKLNYCFRLQQTIIHTITIPITHDTKYIQLYVLSIFSPRFPPDMPRTSNIFFYHQLLQFPMEWSVLYPFP